MRLVSCREKALLNDINPHLVNFYKWLKKGLVIKGKLNHSEAAYYKARNRFNAMLKSKAFNTAEAAALFYYLNRTGYNGLCRFNSSGGFNVPFGRYPKLKYKYDFSEYASVFKAWRFSNVHFSQLKLADDDFVYADPPYDVEFTNYSKGGFSWAEPSGHVPPVEFEQQYYLVQKAPGHDGRSQRMSPLTNPRRFTMMTHPCSR